MKYFKFNIKNTEVKKLLLRKSLLLIFYTLIHVYFIAFNWQIFTLTLNINLGFTVVKFPPFIAFFLLGFIFLGILTWINYISNLHKIIYELEHGVKIGKMSEKQVRMKVEEQLLEEKNVEALKTKLGIAEIRNKQEELIKLFSELKSDLKETQKTRIIQKGQNQKEH